MKESITTFFRKGKAGYIYVPMALLLDSAYPLPKEKCKLKITISKTGLIVSQWER